MKRLILLMLTVAVISFSCDELAEFVLNHTFEITYPIDHPADGPASYSDEFPLDATDNEEVADNVNSISGYTVNDLEYSISGFEPDTGIVSGIFSFSFKNGAGNPIGDVTSLSIDNLFALSASEDKVPIPMTQSTIDAVQDEFIANNKVILVVSDQVSEVPANFMAHVFFKIDIKVDPI